MQYKVLITTSGIGQRLGNMTKYTNKSLVRIGEKPAISHIIEAYPKNITLVITIGYHADQVKNFVKLAYPDRKIEFVDVDLYEGLGSSLGYSMLLAKKNLQCPFIFHACDTITEDSIPKPNKNWIAGYKGKDTSQYASWKVIDNDTLSFSEKGAINFDYLHIGLVGIKDYESFWDNLKNLYNKDKKNSTLNDCQVIKKMLADNKKFEIINFKSWIDMGNMTSLSEARKKIKSNFNVLEKIDESIFIIDGHIIKFFYDDEISKKRITRAKILNDLVPKIEGKTKNFYKYKFVEGELYSRAVTPGDFKNFLNWAKNNLWIENNKVEKKKFKKACNDFYYKKTIERVNRFQELNSIQDKKNIINKEAVPSIEDLLKKIDFEWLADCKQYKFHGDFILDNIIKTKNSYKLIDWRQDFGGILEVGDIYYDLAKLNHNLSVNHDIINDSLFKININNNTVECDIMRSDNLVKCQEILHEFIVENGFDLHKVKLLTSIIWLNMSPIHHHPFNLFLYYFGKLNLWQTLKKK